MIELNGLCTMCHKGVIMEYKDGVRCNNRNCKQEYTLPTTSTRKADLYPHVELGVIDELLGNAFSWFMQPHIIIFITLILTFTLIAFLIGVSITEARLETLP